MTDLDAALLAAETSTQHVHVIATLVFDMSGATQSPYQLVLQRMRERFAMVPLLRQRLQTIPFAPPVWVEEDKVELEAHVHRAELPNGGGIAAIASLVGEVASRPLPRDRPMWEALVIEGLDDNRAALVIKVHHSLVDGVSGIASLVPFFDLEPSPADSPIAETWDAPAAPTERELAQEMLAELRRRPAEVTRAARRVVGSVVDAARAGIGAPLPMAGPRVVWNDALTPRRSVAFTDIAVDEVKSVRGAFGGTVNDVVVTLVAGTLHRYLATRGELPDRALIAAVPTSERAPEHGLAGNRLSMMLYGLPVHLADPLDRLDEVGRSAELAKTLYDRVGVGLFADVASMVPLPVIAPVMRAFSRLRLASRVPPVANVIVSNIRGPGFPLYAAGASLEHMLPIGPLMEGVGLGVTVVSYRDHIDFGFLTCPDLVPDVGALAAGVRTDLDALLALS
ncbi:MAG TPA: wax ester/triacylglycerol synthase family O-acyltransferase [Acidimicrobiales bacterium]|nr:wax ester/triacylglycerol synthase family O-acyltransferase [Acidimicrobiales bacterium]